MDVEPDRDVTSLVVPRVGRVAGTTDVVNPYALLDADGQEIPAVGEFLRAMTADGSPATTLRSYCYELLSWMRFLWAVEVDWDRASRREARDYALWLGHTVKHHRRRDPAGPTPGAVNTVTGKPYPAHRPHSQQHPQEQRPPPAIAATPASRHLPSNSGPIS